MRARRRSRVPFLSRGHVRARRRHARAEPPRQPRRGPGTRSKPCASRSSTACASQAAVDPEAGSRTAATTRRRAPQRRIPAKREPGVSGRRGLRVGVAGATGAVGEEILRLLTSADFPSRGCGRSPRRGSAGRRLPFAGGEVAVEALTDDRARGVRPRVLSCGGARSRRYAPPARERGVVVVDNSSAFRLDPDVPLVVPEINGDDALTHTGLLAVPNCTTIVALMALAPLHRAAGLVRGHVSSYQAASGAGRAALEEYREQVGASARGESPEPSVFPRRLLGNVIRGSGRAAGRRHDRGGQAHGRDAAHPRRARDRSRRDLRAGARRAGALRLGLGGIPPADLA